MLSFALSKYLMNLGKIFDEHLINMLVYSFNIVCLFSVSSYYMYKRTTSEPKGEVAGVKLV